MYLILMQMSTSLLLIILIRDILLNIVGAGLDELCGCINEGGEFIKVRKVRKIIIIM